MNDIKLHTRPLHVLLRDRYKNNKAGMYKELHNHGLCCSKSVLDKWLVKETVTFEPYLQWFPSILNSTHIPYEYFRNADKAAKFTLDCCVSDSAWEPFGIDFIGLLDYLHKKYRFLSAISAMLHLDSETLSGFYADESNIAKSRITANKVLGCMEEYQCSWFIYGTNSQERARFASEDIQQFHYKHQEINNKGDILTYRMLCQRIEEIWTSPDLKDTEKIDQVITFLLSQKHKILSNK